MTKYIAKVLSLMLALAAASNISAADYADFDSPGAWKVSNPSSQQSIEWITDYSPRLKVVKVTMLPIKQWYAEISPKNLPPMLEEEHRHLLESVRNAKPLNMLREMVDSTLMAIAGRESCYSGQNFKYNWIKHRSKLSYEPKEWKFGKFDIPQIPIPGEYKLI